MGLKEEVEEEEEEEEDGRALTFEPHAFVKSRSVVLRLLPWPLWGQYSIAVIS